jgi:hypothetical protein
MRALRCALAAAVVVLVGGCGHGSKSVLITPEGAVGAVRIGDTRATAERHLDQPSTDAVPPAAVPPGAPALPVSPVIFPAAGLVVTFDGASPDARVITIATIDDRYHTAGGAGVGASIALVRKEPNVRCVGEALCQIPLAGGRGTIVFMFEHGRVATVNVGGAR